MKVQSSLLIAAALVAGGCRDKELEARVKKLEAVVAKSAKSLAYAQKLMLEDQAQQEQADREMHAPDAIFAVDIQQNVAGGFVDGPAAGAPVTIVAAEDFQCPYCEKAS